MPTAPRTGPPRARASRSHCQHHHKCGSQHNGCGRLRIAIARRHTSYTIFTIMGKRPRRTEQPSLNPTGRLGVSTRTSTELVRISPIYLSDLGSELTLSPVETYPHQHSLKSPLCLCVSITLPASSTGHLDL